MIGAGLHLVLELGDVTEGDYNGVETPRNHPQHAYERIDHEKNKQLVILHPHATIQPSAVVVEPGDTLVTHAAVFAACRDVAAAEDTWLEPAGGTVVVELILRQAREVLVKYRVVLLRVHLQQHLRDDHSRDENGPNDEDDYKKGALQERNLNHEVQDGEGPDGPPRPDLEQIEGALVAVVPGPHRVTVDVLPLTFLILYLTATKLSHVTAICKIVFFFFW
ncbi:hypothetical protein AGDE_14896 [Angomonas deanei]|nr:hypothetical protein AGDE_14896 [Angomonas deanei]|eukprot:EPY20034.1 hypothetical protein AGDE_14896 [Angomonas deanei]